MSNLKKQQIFQSMPKKRNSTPVGQKARDVLKQDLRNRLKTRIKMCAVGRAGGTSQDVQNVLQKFNDGDEEKFGMMQDIQEDIKGMKQKDAKKYLKHVLSGMNPDQTNSFVDLVKDKLPSQSKNIVDYVKQQKKIKETEVSTKPQVNPETVYTPTRLLSTEQKQLLKTQRNQVKEGKERKDREPDTTNSTNAGDVSPTTTLKITRKKKSFGKINIAIPKITELRDHPTVEQSTEEENVISKKEKEKEIKPKKKTFAPPHSKKGLQQIHDLFPETSQAQTAQAVQQLSYGQRIHNITTFHIKTMEKQREQYLFEAASLVEVVHVMQVTRLQLPKFLAVPDSEEFVAWEQIPPKFQIPLQSNPMNFDVFDAEHPWAYRKTYDEQEQKMKYLQFRNAYESCRRFVTKLDPVVAWLQILTRQKKVPLQWFSETLQQLGIMQEKTEQPRSNVDKTWKHTYRLLCDEFRDKTNQKCTVPIVPFVQIIFQC
jgi:hypothetical protein